MEDVKQTIRSHVEKSEDFLSPKRDLWTENENILHCRLADQISQGTKAGVYDPVLSTLSLYRSHRVMAQLASGNVKAISKNDSASSKLMDLTLEKYIIPNANAQFDQLTKYRLVDMYSDLYGGMGAFIDWDVKPNGYVGPDMWLIPIRDIFPQVGAVSIEDSNRCVVRTWQPISYFESLADRRKKEGKDLKNLQKIIDLLKEKPGDLQGKDSNDKSARENNAFPTPTPAKGQGFYKVYSMYERDRWVDAVPAADWEIFRDGKNPHDNGELPIVYKYAQPLLDDIMGYAGYERGKSMQYAHNSLWNLYLDAVRLSIFPPVMLNKNAIADKASIKWSAAAKWMMKVSPQQAAQVLNLTPQGIQTFQATSQATKAAILNMFGTTDTTVTRADDPGFGRTPQALKMQAAQENTGDTVDQFYMEQFITKVNKKYVNLMSKKGGSVQFRMFEDEIDDLAKDFPEVKDMYDEKSGQLTIDRKHTGSVMYDYEIISGSTHMRDQEKQQENLIELFKSLTEGLQIDQQSGNVTSPLLQQLRSENRDVKFGKLLDRIVINGGIQDFDKIIIDKGDDPEAIMEDTNQKFMLAMQQLFESAGTQNYDLQAQMAPGAGGGQPQPGMPQQQMPQNPMMGGMPNG